MSFSNINLECISDNKYELGLYIADGAFSHVYHCINKLDTKQACIVKIQPNDEFIDTAINELNILKKIKKHSNPLVRSNIITYYEHYIDDEYVYTIYERCDMDLNMFNILFQREFNSRVPLFLTHYIIKSCINAIAELNRNNVMHCDIKPDNILIKFCGTIVMNKKKYKMKSFDDFIKLFRIFTNDKNIKASDIINCFTVKMIDFNKSQFINQIYKSTSIQITYYQAPEIVFKNRNFNESIDMWSIGCIIYELITGHTLFDIYNKKKANGKFHNVFNLDDSESDDSSRTMTSRSKSSYSYDDNQLENYVYLLIISSFIGKPAFGEDTAYNHNYDILGGINVERKTIEDVCMDEQFNFIFDANFLADVQPFILLLNNIFIYDINKRLKAADCI